MPGGRRLRARATAIVAVAAGWLLLLAGASGCAARPSVGEVVHARVILHLGVQQFDAAFASQSAAGGDSIAHDPGRNAAILGLVADGATREDAQAGRLLLASCRCAGDSGTVYAVLLPAGVRLPEGDRVEIELVVGRDLPGQNSLQRARFTRLLPHRATGRTHCDPTANH